MVLFCASGAETPGSCTGETAGGGSGPNPGVAVACRTGSGVGVNSDSSLRGSMLGDSTVGIGRRGPGSGVLVVTSASSL